jgi:UDP-N-acetylglucosamine transferase subunit ALG13
MPNMKNVAISIAVALAMAACGGSSSDPVEPVVPPAAPGGDTPPTTPPTTPPETPPTTPPADATIQGDLTLANHVLFNGIGIDYAVFNNVELGAYGFERGTSAPLQTFGLRVRPNTNMWSGGAQSETVRIAIELADVASGTGQLIQLLIDQATLSISAAGALSVAVPDASRAHVVVRNSAGETVTAHSGSLPANVVRLTTVDVADPTSQGLTVDLDAAMAAAIAAAPEAQRPALLAARDVVGRFNLRMTVSGLSLIGPTGTALVGQAITVGTQPVVNGGGVTGLVWIGVTPPAP